MFTTKCERKRNIMEKMTKREFMEAIVKFAEEGAVGEEYGAFAKEEIEKLDAALEKRREKVSAKQAENAPLMDKIYEMLGDEPMTATVVGEMLEVSTQKASALLRKMVEEGRAAKTDVKIPKKGVQKGYTRV